MKKIKPVILKIIDLVFFGHFNVIFSHLLTICSPPPPPKQKKKRKATLKIELICSKFHSFIVCEIEDIFQVPVL